MNNNKRLALLIDAEDQFYDHIYPHLKADEYDLLRVDNELPVVESIEQHRPDLVMIALDSSSLDLSALISTVTRHAPELPVIALSKEHDERLISSALELGVWDILSLPLDKPIHTLMIGRVLELARLRGENRRLRSQITNLSILSETGIDGHLTHLKQVNAEWRAAFDGVRDPIFVHDQEGCIIRANRAYAERTSLPFNKIIGRPYWEIFPKSDGPLPQCKHTLHKGLDASVDYISLETGEVFLSRAFMTSSSDECQTSYIHILEDVTEQRKHQMILRRRDAIMQAIASGSEHFLKDSSWEENISLVLEKLGKATQVSRVYIFKNYFEEGLIRSRQCYEWTEEGISKQIDNPKLQAFSFQESGLANLEGKLSRGELIQIQVNDLDGIPRKHMQSQDIVSLILAPIFEGGRWWGFIGFDQCFKQRVWTPPEIDALKTLTETLSATIDRANTEKSMRVLTGAIESSMNAVAISDLQGRLTYVNQAFLDLWGFEHKTEVLDRSAIEFWQEPAEAERVIHALVENDTWQGELQAKRKDGSIFISQLSANMVLNQTGEPVCLMGSFLDITAHRRMQDLLKESEQRYRTLFDSAHDAIMVFSENLFVECNRAALDMFRCEEGDILEKSPGQLSPEKQADGSYSSDKAAMLIKAVERGESKFFEWTHRRIDGSLFDAEVSLSPLALPNKSYVLAIVRDISPRKRAERARKKSEQGLAEAQRIAQLGNWEWDILDNTLYWSDEVYRIFGLFPQEFDANYEAFLESIHPADRDAVKLAVNEALSDPETRYSIEHRVIRPDDVERVVHETGEVTFSDSGEAIHMIGTVQDITEQKETEEALIRTSRSLLTLSNCNQALVHATDEAALIADVCRIIVETGSYCGAWVGYVEQDEYKTLKPVTSYGVSQTLLNNVDFSWADDRPPGKAIRTGTAVVVQDVFSDPDTVACCELAIANGFQSIFAFPLMGFDESLGVLVVYAEGPDAFANDEVNMLCELSEDLAYGIQALRTRILHSQAESARAQAAIELQSSLVQTIQAIAVTVEKRDPYTFGHQQRVAKLATAMALEMGLDQDRIEGIRLGALIHDIGKISVPSEILTRPGRLNDIEYAMMKSHTEHGYDIIKDVNFPWPVQEMVVQHHERLNGEGYPYGLKGDEIILEARILAVADVVEAMSSHRPYRPSLGIEPAIDEITNKRGDFFDSNAVDACKRLIIEKGFKFT
ncbi:MAG: PAS domain S-box protein [Sedimenticola sp.]